MKQTLTVLTLILIVFSSCTTMRKTMVDSNVRINFDADDFDMSPVLEGQAKQTRVLGIAFGPYKSGHIPGTGSHSRLEDYAIFKIMAANPGYEAVFYPQYHTRKNWWFFGSTTRVTVYARLGKLKDDGK